MTAKGELQKNNKYSFQEEENNDLFQNMSNQHYRIKESKIVDTSQTGCQGDMSIQIPSSLLKIDYSKFASQYANTSKNELESSFQDRETDKIKHYRELSRFKIHKFENINPPQISLQEPEESRSQIMYSQKNQDSFPKAKSDYYAFKSKQKEDEANQQYLYSKSLNEYNERKASREKRSRYNQAISLICKEKQKKNSSHSTNQNFPIVQQHTKSSNEDIEEMDGNLKSILDGDDAKGESHVKILQNKQKPIQTNIHMNLKIRGSKSRFSNFERGIQKIQIALANYSDKNRQINSLLQKFYKLLSYRSKNKKMNLSSQELAVIADKTTFPNQNNSIISIHTIGISEKGGLFSKFTHFLQDSLVFILSPLMSKHIPLFFPTDHLVLIWDVFNIISISSFLYFYSIFVFFGEEIQSSLFGIFFYIILSIVMIDTIIQFNTAFFFKDSIITQKSTILKKKLFSHQFVLDIIVITVIISKLRYQGLSGVVYNPNHSVSLHVLNSILFLLLNRNIEKKKKLDDIILLKEDFKHVYKLLCQVSNVLTAAHIVAILMYILYLIENSYSIDDTWVSQTMISRGQYYQRYIYAMYWSITTMTTVGYGDITIANSYEAIFVCVVMILFSCVFAYSVSNIGLILQEIEKNSKDLQSKLTTMEKYMNRKNVNTSLKSRVRFYLHSLSEEQKNFNKTEEDKVLSLLSNRLRNEIKHEVNSKILNQYLPFISNFSNKIIKDIAQIMDEIVVAPNEIIFSENDVEDLSLYFLLSGQVEMFVSNPLNQQNLVLAQLRQGSTFGEISFFSGLARSASARSVNLSTIYKIPRLKLINLLTQYEEDFEKFKMIEELIKTQQNNKNLFISCFGCKQRGHTILQCPKLHTNLDRQLICLRHTYYISQKRNQVTYNRKQRRLKAMSYINSNLNRCILLKNNCKDWNEQTALHYVEEKDEKEEDDDNSDTQTSSLTKQNDVSQHSFLQVSNSKKDVLQKNPIEKYSSKSLIEQIQMINNEQQNQIYQNISIDSPNHAIIQSNQDHNNSFYELTSLIIPKKRKESRKKTNQTRGNDTDQDQNKNQEFSSNPFEDEHLSPLYRVTKEKKLFLNQKWKEFKQSSQGVFHQGDSTILDQQEQNIENENAKQSFQSQISPIQFESSIDPPQQQSTPFIQNQDPQKQSPSIIDIKEGKIASHIGKTLTHQQSFEKDYQSQISRGASTSKDTKHRKLIHLHHLLQNNNIKQSLANTLPIRQNRHTLTEFAQILETSNLVRLLDCLDRNQKLGYEQSGLFLPAANTKVEDMKFDSMKIFKKFFPLNNYNLVLKSVKSMQKGRLKLQKVSQWQNSKYNSPQQSYSGGSPCQPSFPTHVDYKPTSASYGIHIRNKISLPRRYKLRKDQHFADLDIANINQQNQ